MPLLVARDCQLLKDVLKLGALRGKLCLVKLPGELFQRKIASVDLIPDPPGLLIVSWPDPQVTDQIFPLAIGHQQKGPVHAETFARGNCGHCN